MRRIGPILLTTSALGCGIALGSAAGVSQSQQAPFQMAQAMSISLPVVVDNRYVGDISVEVPPGFSPDVRVDAVRLVGLLEDEVSSSVLSDLRSDIGGRQIIALSAISVDGLSIVYNPANVEIMVQVAAGAARARETSIRDELEGRPELNVLTPSWFSAAISANLQQTFTHRPDSRRGPFTAGFQAFLSFGGAEGAVLFGDFQFREGDEEAWSRGNIVLFHDDAENAIRYSLGDILPQTGASLPSAPVIGGLGIERRFQDIRPFQNIRSSGRATVRLERTSTVEVFVNGQLRQTRRLGPGTYSLTDFPLAQNANDVVLVVTDDTGRREQLSFSAFNDIALLEAGTFNFGVYGGYPQIASFPVTYLEQASVSGFIEYGLTDWLTVGATAQWTDGFSAYGGSAVIGSSFGVLSVSGAVSQSEVFGDGHSWSAQFRTGSTDASRFRWQFDGAYDFFSENFLTLDQVVLPAVNIRQIEQRANARLSVELPWQMNLSAQYGYTSYHDLTPDQTTYGIGLSRSFDRIGVSLSYDRTDSGFGDNDDRIFLSISYRFDGPLSARAFYDSDRNTYGADVSRFGLNYVDNWSARASLERSDDGTSFNGSASYIGNRFVASVDHQRLEGVTNETSEATTISAGTAIAFSGAKLAVGRPLNDGFVIIDSHRTMGNAKITARPEGSKEEVIAKTDFLGAALVPTERPFVPITTVLEVSDAPMGYDLGDGRITTFGGARSGYSYTVGSAASITVLGQLVDSAGQPVALVSGVLRPIEGTEAAEATFFTNRAGRLVASKVAPGRYAIVLTGETVSIGEIVIPADTVGTFDAGRIVR